MIPRGHPLAGLVSEKFGIVKMVGPAFRGADEPSPPVIYTATLSHFDFRQADKWERACAGKGRTAEEAFGGAMGEALEHYAAAHVAPGRQVTAARQELQPGSAVAPSEFVLYSPAQYQRRGFPYHRHAAADRLTWTRAIELPNGREVFVPTALVYLTEVARRREDALAPSTSNGLAAGPNLQAAQLAGFLELVERDAFLTTWLNRMIPTEVTFPDGSGLVGEIRAHYRRFGVELRLFWLPSDLAPYAMMAVALDDDARAPASLVGLGCHLDPAIAAAKAIFEICQIRPGEKQRFTRERPFERLVRHQDVSSLQDHSAFFFPPARRSELAFVLGTDRRAALADLPNRSESPEGDLTRCLGSFSDAGLRAFYVDLTTPDLADYPVRVVRTLVTQLQPMHFGFGEERLGGDRLFELPMRLGFASGRRTESELNPCPHPLA